MDGELVTDSPPSKIEGSGRDNLGTPLLSYTEVFENHFPYYLSIGMSYDQYWNDDPHLVKYYREADKIKKNRMNEQLWLQGMYVYEAILDSAPVLNFASRDNKPIKYPDRPYPIDEESIEKRKIDNDKKEMVKAKNYMDTFMKQFKPKEVK